jgi:hypothetical protein
MTDPERGGGRIESQGQEFAAQLKQRMYSGQEKNYPYVQIRYEDILKLSRLATGVSEFPRRERFEEDLRFNPITGAIYTTRWTKLETFEDPATGRWSIEHPEDYTFISYWSELPGPEDLPQSGKAIGLVAGEVWEGLEPAIRQQYHILEKYQPASLTAEPQALRRIFYWMDQTSQKFREGPITKDQLEQLSQEGAELITQASLTSAVDETKKKLAIMLAKATKPDSLKRINPMISRIRLRSALLAATRRIVTAELVRRKFSANLEVLVAEREFTRYNLEQACGELSAILHVLRQPRQNSTQISEPDRKVLVSKIRETAQEYLSFPRVAPYLIPARLAAIFLVGCKESKKELNRQVLGEGIAEEVFSFMPATSLLQEGDIKEADRRISCASSILEEALRENDALFVTTDVGAVNSLGV